MTSSESLKTAQNDAIRSQTFAEMLQILRAGDEAASIDFDPNILIGDLKDKVDALKYVLDFFRGRAQVFRDEAEELIAAARATESKAARIEDYMAVHMDAANFEKLPGEKYYVRLIKRVTKALAREATAEDAIEFGSEFVERRVTYVWKAKELKASADKGEARTAALFTEKTSKFVRFWTNTDKEPKPKKVKTKGQEQ